MANYAVTDFTTPMGSLKEVIAAMEVYLETIDQGTQTVQQMNIVPVGGSFQGWIMHTA